MAFITSMVEKSDDNLSINYVFGDHDDDLVELLKLML